MCVCVTAWQGFCRDKSRGTQARVVPHPHSERDLKPATQVHERDGHRSRVLGGRGKSSSGLAERAQTQPVTCGSAQLCHWAFASLTSFGTFARGLQRFEGMAVKFSQSFVGYLHSTGLCAAQLLIIALQPETQLGDLIAVGATAALVHNGATLDNVEALEVGAIGRAAGVGHGV